MSGYYNRNNRGISKKLGPVTAYADAVLAGYTGTREQWAQDMAKLGQNVTQVAQNTELTTELAEQARENTEQVAKDTADVRRLADETSENAVQVASNTAESNRLAEETKQAAAQAKVDAEYAGAAADNFRVDTTLSEAGKAAEAKTTGEKFAQLSEEIAKQGFATKHKINANIVGKFVIASTGAEQSREEYSTTDYIDVSFIDTMIVRSYVVEGHSNPGICLYDVTKAYISGVSVTNNPVTLDVSNACYIRISCETAKKEDAYYLYPVAEIAYHTGRAGALFADRKIDLVYDYGKIDNDSGEITDIIPRNSLITPELWYADVGNHIRITETEFGAAFRVFEYDANKMFLRTSDLMTGKSYNLSADCKFFRLTITNTAGTAIETPEDIISKVYVTYFGLNYDLYVSQAQLVTPTQLDALRQEIEAEKTRREELCDELSEKIGENTDALERLRYPQATELFINPPAEEYPFPGNLPEYPINEKNQLATVYAMWDELETRFPSHVSMEILGKDASGTYDIRAYTITSNSDKCIYENARHLKVLYMSTLHGNESTCAYEDYWFFKNLLENHSSGINRVLWDNVTFKIIPICNPWGFQNLSRLNANGVNLNRNFSGNWTYISQAEEQYNYSGESAMSEVESQIISQFISNNADAFFCFNRHNTETFTSVGKVGYLMSWWDIDVSVYRAMVNKLDTAIKSEYPWVLGDVSENANRSVFYIPKTSYAARYPGSLDTHWTLEYGLHGALIEVGTRVGLGADYPNGTMSDLMAIGVRVVADAITYPVVYNNAILRSNDRYKV